MKKIIILFAVLLMANFSIANTEKDSINRFTYLRSESAFSKFSSTKCDACGCSASGGSMGFSSMLASNFVGVRYFYQNYSSRDGIFSNSPWIRENFNTIQLWSRIPVGKSFQISLLAPYQFHDRTIRGSQNKIEGLGDITILAMATVVRTQRDSTVFKHEVQIGGGVKAPTGKYKSVNNLGTFNPSFQLGTGSWDYIIAAEYGVKKTNIGLNTSANYTFKTTNSVDYKFGNQFNYAALIYYLFDFDKIKIAPQAGIAGEVYTNNKHYNQVLPNTNGDIFFSKSGIEAGMQNFSVGVNYMHPLTQNLLNGNVIANYRWSVNLNYSL